MEGLKKAFAKAKSEGRAALVGYFTSGYPTVEETADIMLGMQAGGVGMKNLFEYGKHIDFLQMS